jgi:hypothetical protein
MTPDSRGATLGSYLIRPEKLFNPDPSGLAPVREVLSRNHRRSVRRQRSSLGSMVLSGGSEYRDGRQTS